MKNQWQRQIETNKRVKEKKLEHIIHSLRRQNNMVEHKNTKSIVHLAKKIKKTKEKSRQSNFSVSVEWETINFNTVSKVAGVSKSWLYKQEGVRKELNY